MQSEMPFFDNPEHAIRACIEALGGAKKVGASLFPDKTMENARDYLLACVNPDRNEKLSLSQIIFLLKEAKEAGHHAPFNWMAGEIGYDAKPITKAEEVDRITQVVEQSSKTLAAAVAALERIQRSSMKGVA